MKDAVEVQVKGSDRPALISPVDTHLVSQYSWRLNCYGYVEATKGSKRILMHRLVMGVAFDPYEMMVDHKFGDRMDNRRDQLRLATARQNGMNKSKPKGNTTSGYKGVSFDARRNKWLACIHYEGKSRFLGRYDTEKDAATAYDKMARQLFGDWARSNLEETV